MTDNKASSSRGRQPGIQFSTAIGTPETKRKMLLYRRLLSRELARDGKNTQEIARARNRRLQEQDQGRFPKS
ncbi:uncharacterized protein LOC119547221 [Drosophila subpulchrella]|uniref:uncharacterized protein LOC119547221 n=1 Tax=Drosophila subpulchrella TaxID=1486046 RepID=UPI0018A1777D|nr:uncharacterized protein LOC119547221 [Drosophila subpulchrella]